MQRIEQPKQTTIHDLLPGDIFFFNAYGIPHTGIYAPSTGRQGDIIHMYYDENRAGATRSTLSNLLLGGKEIYVFRNKNLDGQAIADQAEFWLNQGVEYDKTRLAKSIYDYTGEEIFEEYNILKYLLIAARRETMPIKVHEFPYPPTSMITDIGLALLLPDYTYCWPLSYLGSLLAMYDAGNTDRPKGMTCVTFVLSCIAAVALKDEINPVTAETGWVSLKHSDPHPGLPELLTDNQRANFDIDRIRQKLTPVLTQLDPRTPSPEGFYNAVRTNEENWELIGLVDETIVKDFDKAAYRQEQIELDETIKTNRQIFFDKFGEEIFNRHHNRLYRHFTLFNEKTASNPPVRQDNKVELTQNRI